MDFDEATQKAQMLTRMAVARAAKLEALKVSAVPVNHTTLIIGGGAVIGQTLDINDELIQDTTQACNAISTSFLIGGRAQEPAE